jgi:hypothetical protein
MKNIILSLVCFHVVLASAQDSLPAFSVINKGNNRIVVSWNNKFKKTAQISIQRSPDSLNNFKTIMTVPDPMNSQNGYLDAKAENDRMFYRLYILIDGSNFMFSKPKRPVTEAPVVKVKAEEPVLKVKAEEPVVVKPSDTAITKVITKITTEEITATTLTTEEIILLKKIKNNKLEPLPRSISKKIDDAIKISDRPEIIIPIYHIYTTGDGSVQISLRDYQQKKYSIRFYEDDDTFLYEIKNINTVSLKLDKSNFYHSGWFKSELYDNGKLVERNRFFLSKDF